MVETCVGQLKTECVFPVNTPPNRIRCLSVREPFRELEHRRKSQPTGCLCGLAAPGKQAFKLLVLVHAVQHISDAKACTTLRKRCQSHSPRFVWNAESLLWSERHASIFGTSAATCTTRIHRECQSCHRHLEFATSVNVASTPLCPATRDHFPALPPPCFTIDKMSHFVDSKEG